MQQTQPLGLQFSYYNTIVVLMIPDFVTLVGSPWPVLPPGEHLTTLDEVEARYAINRHRRMLFEGLVVASLNLRFAGCPGIYLDGSYVTAKPRPGDYDACWDPAGVDKTKLDPLFRQFSNGRAAQKAAFLGEFFPSSFTETASGLTFVEFFKKDRFSGGDKGILAIPLTDDLLLKRRSS
jgi:hypothetical protein